MRPRAAPASRRSVRGEIHPALVAVGLAAALGGGWWLSQSDASPDPDRVSPPTQPTAEAAATAPTSTVPADAGQAPAKPLYRWADESGVVHFTDVPPTDRPYVEADVDPERNVLQSPVEPEP